MDRPRDSADISLAVRLRPEDIQAKCIESRAVSSNKVILKISAPKWTGRKRKRCSDSPFEYVHSTCNSNSGHTDRCGPDLHRVLSDNPGRYTVAAVGKVSQTHRFRNLPDFQHATTTWPLAQRLRETVMTNDLDKIKQFSLDHSEGSLAGLDIGPPPSFNLWKVPMAWDYKQTPYSKLELDPATGKSKLVNINPTIKRHPIQVAHDIPIVPSGPPDYLEPEGHLDPPSLECLRKLRALLEERPVIVKRAQENIVRPRNEYHLRSTWPYVGYMFRVGPFRDSIIKYGVDPRSDIKYRKYQTLIFQLPPPLSTEGQQQDEAQPPGSPSAASNASSPSSPPPRTRSGRKKPRAPPAPLFRTPAAKYKRLAPTLPWQRPNDSHIFDGSTLHRDGKTWQMLDIVEPILRALVDTPEPQLRRTCDILYSGWYGNGTYASIRLIMKEKLRLLAEGAPPGAHDETFRTLVDGVPPVIADGEEAAYYYKHTKDPLLLRLSAQVRVVARWPMLKELQKQRVQAKGLLGIDEEREDVQDGAEDVEEREMAALREEDEVGEMGGSEEDGDGGADEAEDESIEGQGADHDNDYD